LNIISSTSRKRETYSIQIESSLLWESALGIAAITNKQLIDTLDKAANDWVQLRESLTSNLVEELSYVEENNTWKALLQVLHYRKSESIEEFCLYIDQLAEEELKYICLPFTGNENQRDRKAASKGNSDAVERLKKKTRENPFFPAYIEFISVVEISLFKNHIKNVMKSWYLEVIRKDESQLTRYLQRDAQMKEQLLEKIQPEQLVEIVTGGRSYLPEPSTKTVLLIPQFIYRPWTIEADIEGTKVFYYPISNESISPKDPFKPNQFLVLKYKALGDEARLKMIKLLYQKEMTLQELTDRLQLGKSTVHHHLKMLKAAKLVFSVGGTYSLHKTSLSLVENELEQFLHA